MTDPEALEHLLDWTTRNATRPAESGGRFEARIVEMATLSGEARTFHPKSWRFEGPGWGTAFVGSSNISGAALGAGIEWNLRVDRHRDPETFERVVEAFEVWWDRARHLDAAWVAAYATRPRRLSPPPGEPPADTAEPPPNVPGEPQAAQTRKPRSSQGGEPEQAYLEHHAQRDERPTAGYLVELGFSLNPIREAYGSWFGFLKAMGHLTPAEGHALEEARDWLLALETTSMEKSYKMVVLEVLIEANALHDGLPLPDLARRSHAWLERHPEFFRDLVGVKALPDPHDPGRAFLQYWNQNPINAWPRAAPRGEGRVWFRRKPGGTEEWFVPDLPRLEDPEAAHAQIAMMRELIECRLAQYRVRAWELRQKETDQEQSQNAQPDEQTEGRHTDQEQPQGAQPDEQTEIALAIEAKVIWNQRTPILKLPSREALPDRPLGEVDAELSDGSAWRFRFMKEYCKSRGRSARTRTSFLVCCEGGLARTRAGPAHVRMCASCSLPEATVWSLSVRRSSRRQALLWWHFRAWTLPPVLPACPSSSRPMRTACGCRRRGSPKICLPFARTATRCRGARIPSKTAIG